MILITIVLKYVLFKEYIITRVYKARFRQVMIMNGLILPAGIGVPLLGAFLMPLLGKRSEKLRNACSLAFVAFSFVCALAALGGVLKGEPLSFGDFSLPLGLSFGFKADALAVFMALTASLVSSIIVIYSYGYIEEYDNQNEYYMMVTFFIGAMMGLVYSDNLIFIYLFWELSSLCCWRLIGFYREEITIKRANKAFIVTVLGALIMLIGFVGIWGEYGTFCLSELNGSSVPDWCVWCILFGILSKSATFPLHSWLPDAGVAPSPVTSLLHAAVLVKIGVYAYARLFVETFTVNEAFTVWVPAIAAVSALISAGAALKQMDIKRVVAYSTISQLAFILLGLSSGTEVGLVGGLLYILAHSVAKGGLFLCCGIVEHNCGTKDMTKLGGLIKTMPKTAAAYILCALSVMGIPPFSGFFAKYMVIDAAVTAEHPVIAVLFIAGAVMTVMYLVRLFAIVFLGEQKMPQAKEGSSVMVNCVLVLGVLSLVLGLAIFFPTQLAELARR